MKALLLLCNGWGERLGGREEVEKRANGSGDGTLVPFAFIYCVTCALLTLGKALCYI